MTDPTDPTLDTTTADEMLEEPSGLAAFVRARIQATAEQPELPAEDSVDEGWEEDVPDSGEEVYAGLGMSRDLDYKRDAQWLQDNWDDLADHEQLEVSMGGMRLFLRERLTEALSEPAPSDHEEDE